MRILNETQSLAIIHSYLYNCSFFFSTSFHSDFHFNRPSFSTLFFATLYFPLITSPVTRPLLSFDPLFPILFP